MIAPTNGSGGGEPCAHEAWETHHGGGARCIDCRQYLPTPPAQVGAATDSGEAVKEAVKAEYVRQLQADNLWNTAHEVERGDWDDSRALRTMVSVVSALASPTKPFADSVEAVRYEVDDRGLFCKHCGVTALRHHAHVGKAGLYCGASMPSTDREGLVGTTSADTILYSIKHHLAVMGDTREGLECAFADAKSLVANLEARARQMGSEGA